MNFQPSNGFAYSIVAGAVFSALAGTSALAQETAAVNEKQIEKIEVTATRRAGSLQEVPINISAVTSDVMQQQNIEDLDDVARWVPGLTVTDQGGRNDSPIIVRGLNTNSSGPGSDGGTVATYFGEIPLFLNMRLVDVDRVEVLIGPQGTLYGAGTLGGAIRYLPKKVDLDFTSGEIFGDVFSLSESSSAGGEGGFVFNAPLVEGELGLRASVNYYSNPGFIDYNYVVRESGVSLPDPDWSDDAAVSQNLKKVKDANGEDTLTARVALRWVPTDWLDGTLTYFYQKQEVEGRSISQYKGLSADSALNGVIQQYESAYRYEEPREKKDQLLSLELTADLGFAELVSATGYSKFDALGQRDQTDLLIRLAYSYEEFPAFSSYTEEVDNQKTLTQEIRLVSQTDGPLSWIVGGYYNKSEYDGYSKEFTPNFDKYAIDVWGVEGNYRPDSLEYYSVDDTTVTESALFGELSYEVTDKLDVTVGLRAYKYDVEASSAVDIPLANSVYGSAPSDAIELIFEDANADDTGTLFKFNASYQFTRDTLGYFTVSEGFRIGGANGVAACPPDVEEREGQIICAQPNEQVYEADTTTNYEIGLKNSFLGNKLQVNAALFFVDWNKPQVGGATQYGQQPITVNAKGAESKGAELSLRALLSDELTVYATYAYTTAELTADAPALFSTVEDEDFPDIQDFYDGKDGDRLPGSPEQQFSFGATYSEEVFDGMLLDLNYGITAQSDLYSTVGLRQDGEVIPGFAVSNFSARLSEDMWSVTFYVDNLFDKYAYTSVRGNRSFIGEGQYDSQNANRNDLMRGYGHYILTPRTIGLKFRYQFEL